MHSWLNGNKGLIKRRVGGTPRSRRASTAIIAHISSSTPTAMIIRTIIRLPPRFGGYR